jgi:hypothetical protein
MTDTCIIRHRSRRFFGSRSTVHLAPCALALSALASTFACELVIGDAPPMKAEAGGADGGKSETSGAGGIAGSGGTPAGKPGAGGVLVNGGTSARGGSSARLDAGQTMMDAGGLGGRDTVDAASPSPETGAGGGPPCTADVTWYQDADGDGYGSTVAMSTCPKPAGNWALAKGDCDDRDPTVNPGQKKYFGVPYKKSDNTDSFDYDCSGTEDANPDLAVAPEDCGPLKLALCGTASGYETNNRVGTGIDAWCGSTTVRVCTPSLLLCTTTERTGQPPFSCR